MTAPTISILGCGWLGLPLGEHLARQGYRVQGSTTTPAKLEQIRAAGITPFLLTLDPALEGDGLDAFFGADVLFLNIPPGRRDPALAAQYPDKVRAVCAAADAGGTGWIVFAGSTSVYPDLGRVVREEEAGGADSVSGRALLEAERVLQAARPEATILRFAGLYGYDRQPGRFLAGRRQVAGGEAPVNLVHRDDSVAVVAEVLRQDARGEVFNVCADAHPTRRALYVTAAERLGLEPPHFEEGDAPAFKVVGNEKLKRRLGYHFRYPDPLQPAP